MYHSCLMFKVPSKFVIFYDKNDDKESMIRLLLRSKYLVIYIDENDDKTR